jgi:hypothetical protein
MSEESKDVIGQIVWYLMFLSPIICMILCWKFLEFNKVWRVIIGFLLGIIFSFFLYFISLAIIFRGGMGPT